MSDWLVGKSAKQWVNEICVKQLIRPKWETREAHPGQQPPTFICNCTIAYVDRTLTADGSGKTKKEAEQEAALEMLKRLGMTPATLMQLNNSSKNKDTGGSSSSTCRGASVDDEGEVTDTDDKDAEAHCNPIGELLAICDQHEFQDPEYEDVGMEGPPHRRIFTVKCTVHGVNISFTGRRHTKKIAKKIAAFRVMREINKQGYIYTRHSENGGEDGADLSTDSGVSNLPSTSSFDVSDISSGLDDVVRRTIGTMPNESINVHPDLQLLRRGYCNDSSHGCLQFCKDYPHAFAHLKQSETLDRVLEMDNIDSISEEALALLQAIAHEVEIKLQIANVESTSKHVIIKLLQLTFTFEFKYPVPKKVVVYGLGSSDQEAEVSAYKQAIEFLRSQLISE